MAFFPACAACGVDNWQAHWSGPVRDGAFGRLTRATEVARCGGCGVLRLAEDVCKDESFYQTSDYREFLKETPTAEGFFAEHDPLQMERLRVTAPHLLRAKAVADVGCAGGAFLDHVKGLVRLGVAIEPARIYHASLRERGYAVYPDLAAAAVEQTGRMDYVFSFSVIEHVAAPLDFVRDMFRLLAPAGRMVISTPNRDDILMQLLPDAYPRFFYRSVHRWYFDRDSLAGCARRAGLEVEAVRCVHRFGLDNAMLWLRDRKPPGRSTLAALDDAGLDHGWRHHLERKFIGDYLYAMLRRG